MSYGDEASEGTRGTAWVLNFECDRCVLRKMAVRVLRGLQDMRGFRGSPVAVSWSPERGQTAAVEQSFLKIPHFWEDQPALYSGRATSSPLSARMPAVACVSGLEPGGHCVLSARAPMLLGDSARMLSRGSRLRKSQVAVPPPLRPHRYPARPARPPVSRY